MVRDQNGLDGSFFSRSSVKPGEMVLQGMGSTRHDRKGFGSNSEGRMNACIIGSRFFPACRLRGSCITECADCIHVVWKLADLLAMNHACLWALVDLIRKPSRFCAIRRWRVFRQTNTSRTHSVPALAPDPLALLMLCTWPSDLLAHMRGANPHPPSCV